MPPHFAIDSVETFDNVCKYIAFINAQSIRQLRQYLTMFFDVVYDIIHITVNVNGYSRGATRHSKIDLFAGLIRVNNALFAHVFRIVDRTTIARYICHIVLRVFSPHGYYLIITIYHTVQGIVKQNLKLILR